MQTHSRIVTTEAVLWEWLNALSGTAVRAVAAEGYARVRGDGLVEVVAFEPDLREAAVGLYRSRIDKSWSLTDCLSFVVMSERRLVEALTTDCHFEQAGFRVLLDGPIG